MKYLTLKFLFTLLLVCLPFLAGSAAYSSGPLVPAASLADLHLPIVTSTMLQYSRIRYCLYFFSVVYSLGVLFLIMQTGISARIRDYSIRAHRFKAIQLVVYSLVLSFLVALLTLPLSFFSGFYLEHLFKLSDQSLLSWFSDRGKTIGVSAILSCFGLLVFFGVVRRFRKHWPLLLWLIMIPFFALGIFAEPIVIDPLFNTFTPMEQSSLKAKITNLAVQAGIPNAVVLVADKSKQTNKMNAYVTGLGDTSRIVLWDSTIAQLPEDQVLAVVGHEIGHYVLGHVYLDFLLLVSASFLFVPLAYSFAHSFVAILPKRWKVGSVEDYAIAPVLLALSLLVGFVSMPLINAWSRYQEHQADEFGLNLTGDRLAMANLFVSFAEKNLSEPDPPPIIKFWLFSHPTLKERIEFAAGRQVQ